MATAKQKELKYLYNCLPVVRDLVTRQGFSEVTQVNASAAEEILYKYEHGGYPVAWYTMEDMPDFRDDLK